MNSKAPVRLPFKAADPFIMRACDGRYYLYCTNEDGMGFPVRSSENLVDWKEHGLAFAAKDAKWGVKCFWAPECYELNGRYYLFYSADWKENPAGALENFRIGVAVSDRPDGGFQDIGNQPIFDPGYPIIDADVYREAGRFFFFFFRFFFVHLIYGLVGSWVYCV